MRAPPCVRAFQNSPTESNIFPCSGNFLFVCFNFCFPVIVASTFICCDCNADPAPPFLWFIVNVLTSLKADLWLNISQFISFFTRCCILLSSFNGVVKAQL